MSKREQIKKTYKLFINGKFPRTESGRYIKWSKANTVVNICRSSRKDFRDAVVAARNALDGWSETTACNRGQIIYRIGEMLEGRKAQFVDELVLQGSLKKQAFMEVDLAIDRLIYYAGWADKFQQIFSRVNPVAAPYFNFTYPEPTGVVAIIADDASSLIGLISVMAPVIAGGNSCVILASETKPLCSISFAEVLHTADVPPGVVNILTGFKHELLKQFATHMDVNAVVYCGNDREEIKLVQELAAMNVKRPIIYDSENWTSKNDQSPYYILNQVESKTTWHPIGM